jgi:hypothetical protein
MDAPLETQSRHLTLVSPREGARNDGNPPNRLKSRQFAAAIPGTSSRAITFHALGIPRSRRIKYNHLSPSKVTK